MLVNWLPTLLRNVSRARSLWLPGTATKRRVRASRTCRIETLEDRALLTGFAPVAFPDAYIFNESTTRNVSAAQGVLQNDVDFESDTLTAVLDSGPANGTLVLNPNGSFSYTPNFNFIGADTFIYHANDGTGNSLPIVVALTVVDVNAPPTGVADSYNVTVNAPRSVSVGTGVLANDMDPEGSPLSAVLDVGPANGTLTLNPDGSFLYTPNANFVGVDAFTYLSNDGVNDSLPTTVTLTVAPLNAPPVSVGDLYNVLSGTTATVDANLGVLANDTDAEGNSLTATLTSGPAHGSLTLNPDGSFIYTPDVGFIGTDVFNYLTNDGTSDSIPGVATLVVQAVDVPPVAVADTYNATAGTTRTVNAANGVLANDIDVEGAPLTAVLDVGPVNGTLTLNLDGSFTYTPNGNFLGADAFTYHANDGTSNSAPVVVTIVVASVNAPPVAVADAYSVTSNVPRSVNAANGVLTNDVDAEGNPLTAVLDVGPTSGTLTLNSDGSFLYTPNANFVGVDVFSYHANDGTSNGVPTVVTLTVSLVNAPPVGVPDAYNVTSNTTRTVTAANGVLINDLDAEGNSLTATVGVGPVNGSLTLNADGSFSYTPNANFVGVDTFTYLPNDGTSNGVPTVVTLTVSAVNAPPVAIADAYSVDAGTARTVNAANGVLTNDIDAEGNALTAVLNVGPTNGTLTLNPDGSFVYTPNAGFTGVDSFIYHANDGTSDSIPTVVALTVAVPNIPPVGVADAYLVTEDAPLTVIAANGVLANDVDLDGDTLTAVLDVGPTHGVLTLNANGSFTYTPVANFTGTDTFTYHANDGSANSLTTLVTLTVVAANTPPVSVNDAYSVNEDGTLNVAAGTGVLANDVDANGDPLTATIVSQPANGAVTLNADGSFSYTPDDNFAGVDTFTYQANDGTTNGNVATVTITVAPLNEAPVIVTSPGTATVKGHRRIILDPSVNLIDVDSPNFGGGSFDAAIQSGAGSRDTLGYRRGGANRGRVNVRAGQLRVGRTSIGTITGGIRGTALHVQFNSNATQDLVERAMQALTFRGTNRQPGPRVVTLRVTDDTGLQSNIATKNVNVS